MPVGADSAPTARTGAVRRTDRPTTARAGDAESVMLVATATGGGSTAAGGAAAAWPAVGAASASPGAERGAPAGVRGRVTAAIAPLAGDGCGCADIVTGSPLSEASAAVGAAARLGGTADGQRTDAEPPGSSTRWPHPCASSHDTVR